MAIIKAVRTKGKGRLGTIIDYVLNEDKTKSIYADGILCTPICAKNEMAVTKKIWHKLDGRQYKHFVISYAPGEPITPERALNNARELIEQTPCMKDFEVLLATHVDKHHIHTHVVVNSVNFVTGKKFQMSNAELEQMKADCVEQSRQQGLHIPEKGKSFDGSLNTNITAWQQDLYRVLEKAESGDYKSFVFNTAKAVLEVMKQATSREDFIAKLKKFGITTVWNDKRKNITFITETGEKVRNSRLQTIFKIDFSKETLENEIKNNGGSNEIKEIDQQLLEVNNDLYEVSTRMKIYERGMKEIESLINHIEHYKNTHKIYVEYNQILRSEPTLLNTPKKIKTKAEEYYNTYEGDLILHNAAVNYFKKQGLKQLPQVKSLKAEYDVLKSQKAEDYIEYKELKQKKNDIIKAQHVQVAKYKNKKKSKSTSIEEFR